MNRTKAQMLRTIRDGLPEVQVLPLVVVTGEDLRGGGEAAVARIRECLGDASSVIVRSSCRNEDTAAASQAGKYRSILGVPLADGRRLLQALRDVYESYGAADSSEEILVQPMLEDVAKSGVVFTRDIETNAPYYVVSYSSGRDTTAVTGGAEAPSETLVRYRNAALPVRDKDMERLLDACAKIETFLQDDALDIEFGITGEGEVYIFQIRPIAKGCKAAYAEVSLEQPLSRLHKKIRKLGMPHPFLLGKRTIFGVMPDWNPAEILGTRPGKLAVSLYKELVTDSVWAHQRRNYGYRDLTMHPLMASFFGIPYIDTRIAFNSFVPASLNRHIAGKLVDYYLDRLEAYPACHDKIEFRIVFSCYCFGMGKRLRTLLDHGFNENEIKRIEFSLLELTNRVIHPERGLYKQDIGIAGKLEETYERIMESGISTVDKIYWLIETCKSCGTLPFAGVARAAFIAVQMLDSMVEAGWIDAGQRECFLNSLDTVAKRMRRDLGRLRCGEMGKADFLERYGHVRPGTYDILSPRYDEAFDEYFPANGCGAADAVPAGDAEYEFPPSVMEGIDRELEDNGLDVDSRQLLQFIRESIEGREALKLSFTKCVSRILQLIEALGERVGIEKEALAHLDISVVRNLYTDLYVGDVSEILRRNIEANRRQQKVMEQLRLPSLIVDPDMVYQFRLLQEEPNFITRKRIAGRPALDVAGLGDLGGKIAFVRSADPGYDFLFGKGIAGLVTQFGGANSHMAIRCAELGLPAVIGAGERNFKDWAKAGRLEIDCGKRQVIKCTT